MADTSGYTEATPFFSYGVSNTVFDNAIEDVELNIFGDRKGHMTIDLYEQDGTLIDTIKMSMKDFQDSQNYKIIDSVTEGGAYAWDSGTKALTIVTGEKWSTEINVSGQYDNFYFEYKPALGAYVTLRASGQGHLKHVVQGMEL